MAKLPIETVLVDFAKTMIRDLGNEDGRRYLLRNIPLWRESYGEVVTKRVSSEIRQLLRGVKR